MLYRVHLAWSGFELTILVMIGTDYTDPTTIWSWPRRPLYIEYVLSLNTGRQTIINQSINQSYDRFAKPPQIYNVCDNFTNVDSTSMPLFRLTRSGLFCPNKKTTMTIEAVILFYVSNEIITDTNITSNFFIVIF